MTGMHEIWEMDIPNRLSYASSIPETKLEELRRRKSVIEQQIADRAEQLRRSQQSWQSHREYSENRVINGLTNHQLLFEQERHERLYSGLDKAQNDGYWRQSTSRLDSLEDVITQRTKDFTSNQLNFSLQRQKLTEERSRLIDARADLRERQQYHHDGLTPSISRTGRLSEPSWLYKSERELPHIAPRADSVKVMKSPHSASSFIHQTEQQLPQQITHYWMLKEKLDEEYRRLQRPYLGELGQQSYQHWQMDDYKMVRSLVEEYVEEFLDGYFELSYGALDKGTANARIEADIRERDNTTRIYREQRAFELISEEIVLQVTRQLYQQLATEVYNTEVTIENMVDTFIIKQVQAAVAEDHGTNDPTSADYEDLLRTTLRTLRHDRHINGSDAWIHTQTLSKAGTSETLESTPSADPAELLDFNPVHRGQWHEQFPSRTDSVKQNMKIYQETELQYWKNLGVVIFSLPLLKRAQGITASSVNNSQQYLALGTGHGDILIYDTKPDQWLSIRAVNNINKKDDPIIDLAWSVDDSLISSINQLGILNIWSFSSSSPVSKADLKTLGLTVNIKDPNTVPHYPTLGLTLDTDTNDFVFKQGPLSEHGNDLTSGHRPMICRFCHNNVSSNEQECVCVMLDNDDIIKCGLEPGEGAEDSREVAQENGNVIGQNLSAELCRDHNYPVMVLMSVGVTDHLLTLDVKGFLNTWTFTQSELSGYGWFRPLKRYKLNMKKTCYISSDSATVNVIFSDKAQHASRKELGQLREQAERDLKELRLGPLWHKEISADRKTKISIYMPQSLQVPESGCIFHVVTRQFSNGALKSYHTQMYEHTKVECSKVLCASPSPSNTELVILMLCPECKPKGACISVFVIDAVNTVITDTRFDIDLAAVEYTACLNKDVVRCCLSCLDKRTGSSYAFLSYLAKLEAYSLATRQLVLKLDTTPGFGGCIVPAALWGLPEMSRVVVLNNDDAIIIVGYAQSYRSVHVLKLSCRSDGQRDAIRAALTGIQHIT